MDTKPIVGAAIGVASVGLLANSLKMLPKNMRMRIQKKSKKSKIGYPKPRSKPLVKGAVDLMVGTALLGGIAAAVK